jgi:UDP-2,3-diacylglucosamine hydrolase
MASISPMYRLEGLGCYALAPMKRLFISDAHLTGLEDPNQALLVELLDQTDAEEVYFLGDIFHFWWGRKDFRDPEFEPLLQAIAGLKKRGIGRFWVRGNHDFHLGPVLEEDLGVVAADRFDLQVHGAQVLLVHGDEADTSLGYRLTRSLLRGRPFAGLMRLLGPTGAKRLGRALAGASRHETGPKIALLEAQRDWASARCKEGADVVVLGHSHAAGIQSVEGGKLVNLGDFAQAHTFLEMDEGLRLCRWDSGHGHTVEEEGFL